MKLSALSIVSVVLLMGPVSDASSPYQTQLYFAERTGSVRVLLLAWLEDGRSLANDHLLDAENTYNDVHRCTQTSSVVELIGAASMATTQPPKTETKTVSETRQHFSETLNRVYRGETRVVVEKSGIAVGVIVSPRDLEALQHIEEERRLTLEAFADARKAFDGIPHEEIEREIEMAIADARAGRRNEDPWAVIGDMREA
ncbi:MAG: type II toxin-antitoxin system Phd/YefM family antitoxin, partial [Chloroflexota bacterium]|nr:type II toxin-antitoxin system Phd/YefM family antitoxin [Chloroflexota bacterium]